jgi:hypothetical protein
MLNWVSMNFSTRQGDDLIELPRDLAPLHTADRAVEKYILAASEPK